MKNIEIPNWLIILGACGQIFTAFIYPYVRHRVFNWYNDIRQLTLLNQAITRTYGHYIQGLNFSFGIISILFINELQSGTGLAAGITGLIAAYWTGKLITQFAFYPMKDIPKKPLFKIGEVLMNTMFVAFSIIYILMFAANLARYLER